MAIFQRGKGRHGPGHRKSALVPTKSILKAANVPIIGGHHVLALQSSPEGWQATPLLERCREHRVAGGRVVQRHVLYLGEINDTQELAWRRSIAVLEDGAAQPRTLSLFPEDRCAGVLADASIVHVKLSQLQLRRPRQWGACWLALLLWRELQLDLFWSKRLGVSRKGTRWDQVLFVLVAYRLLCPGSEWRLHREWFQRSALADLLGEDAGVAVIHKLYRCHDRLLVHKQAVFDHLTRRLRDLFNISYDVLLYDLMSTYFEADPPVPGGDKRRFTCPIDRH